MKLLTIREACERLRISRATLYKLARRGTLTLVKIGGKSLIPEEALLSRQAVVAPKFADFVPVEVTGKPASEMIIDEREAR